jgi:hypothetical protein
MSSEFIEFHNQRFPEGCAEKIQSATKPNLTQCALWAQDDPECDAFQYNHGTKECVKLRFYHNLDSALSIRLDGNAYTLRCPEGKVPTQPFMTVTGASFANDRPYTTTHTTNRFPNLKMVFRSDHPNLKSCHTQALTHPDCQYLQYDTETGICYGFRPQLGSNCTLGIRIFGNPNHLFASSQNDINISNKHTPQQQPSCRKDTLTRPTENNNKSAKSLPHSSMRKNDLNKKQQGAEGAEEEEANKAVATTTSHQRSATKCPSYACAGGTGGRKHRFSGLFFVLLLFAVVAAVIFCLTLQSPFGALSVNDQRTKEEKKSSNNKVQQSDAPTPAAAATHSTPYSRTLFNIAPPD